MDAKKVDKYIKKVEKATALFSPSQRGFLIEGVLDPIKRGIEIANRFSKTPKTGELKRTPKRKSSGKKKNKDGGSKPNKSRSRSRARSRSGIGKKRRGGRRG